MYFTIEGFEQLTRQQIFDMAWKHVISAGRPSVDFRGGCTYAGIGCAAAPFLTPEGRDTLQGSWYILGCRDQVPPHEQDLVISVQICHDSAASDVARYFIATFRGSMRRTAQLFGVSCPED